VRFNDLGSRLVALRARIPRYGAFEEMPNVLLAVLGVANLLVSAEFSGILASGALDWRNAFNQTGYVPLIGWISVALLANLFILVTCSGAVAARCGELLYQRILK
jgi:hypothetical protein